VTQTIGSKLPKTLLGELRTCADSFKRVELEDNLRVITTHHGHRGVKSRVRKPMQKIFSHANISRLTTQPPKNVAMLKFFPGGTRFIGSETAHSRETIKTLAEMGASYSRHFEGNSRTAHRQ